MVKSDESYTRLVNPMQLSALIDAAASIAGSKTRLAASLGVAPPRINDWQSGFRPCPLEVQADLAAIAGLDPRVVVTEAILERTTGTPRGERIARALGKALRGVAATLAYGAIAVAIGAGHLGQAPKRLFARGVRATMYRRSTAPNGPRRTR